MQTITTLDGRTRMSTQALLQTIARSVALGETDFTIQASGQHDIGGPLWNTSGKTITFHITNPGQRVGAMALTNTHIIVHGPAPADVGWLNSGGLITVLGDCGDTAAHSQAEGRICIAGRAGTRTGSLMKKDPLAPEPELWILRSTGSFSFEFMSGGKAVVCGIGVEDGTGVLGERPCVGMVGGTVYVRGRIPELPSDVEAMPIDDADLSFLRDGIPQFLKEIGEEAYAETLSVWDSWQKIVPRHHPDTDHAAHRRDMRSFREECWISNGIFSDIFSDPGLRNGLLGRGIYRLRVPVWNNEGRPGREEQQTACDTADGRTGRSCRDCHLCEMHCPEQAVVRSSGDDGTFRYAADEHACIGCGICAAVCPCGIWTIQENSPIE